MGFNYWQELEEGQVYHIYNKSISSLDLFRDEDDYLHFLKIYGKYFLDYFDTYAYCLIPNHFHLLVRVKTREEILGKLKRENTSAAKKYLNGEIPLRLFLSDQLKRFLSSFTIRYNRKYNNSGSVFVRKLKRIKVSAVGTIQHLLCYIHHNPIHHGLVNSYGQWKYSSYSSYLKNVNTNIAKYDMLNWLGGIDVFKELHTSFRNNRIVENIE